MAFTFGFYNSVNHDRKYDAIQMSRIFDGIIEDGVFMSIGNQFMVRHVTGMSVVVGSGRAWFDHTWSLNDADYPLVVDPSAALQDRIDTVVLDIDASQSVRENKLMIVKGAPSVTPVRPSLIKSPSRNQYPLADIRINRGVTNISQSVITNRVGTSHTPFVTGALAKMDADALIAQWNSQFVNWFNSLNLILAGDVAAGLAARILALESTTSTAPEMRRTTFRGKNLGNTVTPIQKAAIQSGYFDDLFLGDYWTINSINWRIVDMDYWYNTGETPYDKHHLVIMPDKILDEQPMETAVYNYGYGGSTLRQNDLAQARSIVTSAFGSSLLTVKLYLDAAAADGRVTYGNWYDSDIIIPNEPNMFGTNFVRMMNAPDAPPTLSSSVDHIQFALFAIAPKFRYTKPIHDYWLRDPRGPTTCACVYGDGRNMYSLVHVTRGVRPCFAIG